jgi:hypothetical protein
MKDRHAFEREFEAVQPKPPVSAAPPKPSSKPSLRRFRVIDGAGKPLAKTSYLLVQAGTTDQGTLDQNGEGVFEKVDPARPFILHVDSRACIIIEGAVLLVDEAGVEYGGHFLDWRKADEPDADREFWQDYLTERKSALSGPLTFWQHDHITRRPIKLRTAVLNSPQRIPVFQAMPLRFRTGPLVRFTDNHRALIWVELETPGLVRVRFRPADDQSAVPKPGTTLSTSNLQSRHAASVRVGGRHFAIVEVNELSADTFYQYTIELVPLPPHGAIPKRETEFTEKVFPKDLPQAVLDSQANALALSSLRKDQWLFFRTIEQTYERLRFAHGSCRKWPGDTDENGKTKGADMLSVFGSDWMANRKVLSEWPRFLIHSGDQIYADDIGKLQGEQIMKQRFSAGIPGPRTSDLFEGAWGGRFGNRYVGIDPRSTAKAAGPTRAVRDRVSKLEAELKSAANGPMDKALIAKASEYANLKKTLAQEPDYQRAWKFVDPKRPMRFKYRIENTMLWNVPYEPDKTPDVGLTGPRARDKDHSHYASAGEIYAVHAADFTEYSFLHERAWNTAKKVFAHIPSFMIFDDHEITDDWNFNEKWVRIVHESADLYHVWPYTITDGLAAYWMYQGWGNLSPDAWATDERVKILLNARDSGKDALPELRQCLFAKATKPARPGTNIKDRLQWSYELPVKSPQFFVVDNRTEREVYGPGGVFSQSLKHLQDGLLKARASAAFVVFSTPLLLPHPLSFALTHRQFTRAVDFAVPLLGGFLRGFIGRLPKLNWNWKTIEKLARDSDMEHAAGNNVWTEVKDMLAKIQDGVTSLKTIVFLSGDIHFSCNLDASAKGFDPPPQPHLLQLISSGLLQRVPADNVSLLNRSYKYFGFETTGTHRDLRVRLAGMDNGKNHTNFLFEPSIALVDVDVRQKQDAQISSKYTPNVVIKQEHLFWNQSQQKVDSYVFYYENNEDHGPQLLSPGRRT